MVTPCFVGRALRLDTVVVFVSVMLWAHLWSMVGMLVATPLLVVVRTVCERIPALRPVSAFLSGRGVEAEGPERQGREPRPRLPPRGPQARSGPRPAAPRGPRSGIRPADWRIPRRPRHPSGDPRLPRAAAWAMLRPTEGGPPMPPLPPRLEMRLDERGPVRVGVIGAGKFASMFLNQVPSSPHLSVVALADLDPARARKALADVGWSEERIAAVEIGGDGMAVIAHPEVEVVLEVTGSPAAGCAHALAAAERGVSVVMVNVEADVLAGPVLAAAHARAGTVYSMAYGDQPALVAELVDWARVSGFEVVAAGKGTRYQPFYHDVGPDGVWDHYGLTAEEAHGAGMNPQMFCSFLDGTKSAIEMAAIANATGLAVPREGLAFPPVGTGALADRLIPRRDGGVLETAGMVEVVASAERGAQAELADHLRWGVYVVFEAPNAYARGCFAQYGLRTDASGRYAALWRPYHLIGLELGVSVVRAALGEPTGAPRDWVGDVAAVAKRDLAAGETLDGEGGACAWGRLMPAGRSLEARALPIGLAHGVRLRRAVAHGATITRDDVETPPETAATLARAEMEATAKPVG